MSEANSQSVMARAGDKSTASRFMETLGPGILFAATSVGVSHLVQSTRAGAAFGLGMMLVIVLAHAIKYSAFRAGSDYAAATGKSLLFAYRQQGGWTLFLFGMVTLSSMFIVLAAVLLVCAGLLRVVFEFNGSLSVIATIVVALAAAMLIRGRYEWLEKITKLLIALLTLITVITTVVALPQMQWQGVATFTPEQWDLKTILFAVALAGWMPTALDTSVWQSVWTVEKVRSGGVTPKTSRRDFNIGYVLTAVLALCFMLIGASIMHGSQTSFSATATGFATQFIDIYATTLGEWSRPVIGVTAFAVILSTVITVLDGFPRVCAKWVVIVGQLKLPAREQKDDINAEQRWYVRFIVIEALGALCIIYFWLSSFKTLIDLAATVSFLSAPILAVLNHRAMTSRTVPSQHRLKGRDFYLSVFSVACLSIFSLGYLFLLLST